MEKKKELNSSTKDASASTKHMVFDLSKLNFICLVMEVGLVDMGTLLA
jgi:hypothetical protein